MIVALDVDGVIADCAAPVHAAYERILQRKLRKPELWHDFDFATSMFLEPDEARHAHEQITRDGYVAWRIGLYPGAKEFVEELRKQHDVYFLTAEWRGMSSWVPARQELLESAFPGVDIVFTHAKHRAQFDLLVDDKPSTVQRVSDMGREAWIFSRPWNRTATGWVCVSYEAVINSAKGL